MLGETSLKFSSRGVARMARLVAAAGFALTLAACNLTSVPFINDNPAPRPPPRFRTFNPNRSAPAAARSARPWGQGRFASARSFP